MKDNLIECPEGYMTLEELRLLDIAFGIKTGKEKWIFRYLRADGEGADLGFYNTKKEAREARDNFAFYGSMCSEPIEVSLNYELRINY